VIDFAHIRSRQKILREATAYGANFELWEESCVPSYCHANPAAAFVSWLRLYSASRMAKRLRPDAKRVLDFGSSVGELGHLLPPTAQYDAIESHKPAADFLSKALPNSRLVTLKGAKAGTYDVVFAIDSLEHNDNYAELLATLVTKLAPGGVLILSGPTESWLYRLGRRIARFDGHYHETNIHAIEAAAAKLMTRRSVRQIFPGATLFRITGWSK
jgi:2-polyprenyl-3-methyl-5-hydroxy-6-metoxy-1,4-benzoquinol methylase